MSQYSAGLVTFTKKINRHDNKEQNDIDNDIDINRQIAEIDERTRQIELDSLIASSNLYDEPMPEDIAQIMEQFRLLEQGQSTHPQQMQQPFQASIVPNASHASHDSHASPSLHLHLPLPLPLHKVDNYASSAESDLDYSNYPDDSNDYNDSNHQKSLYAIDRELKRQQDEDFQACLFADQEREQEQQKEKEKTKEKEKEIILKTLESQQADTILNIGVDIKPVLLTREELRAQRLKHFNK